MAPGCPWATKMRRPDTSTPFVRQSPAPSRRAAAGTHDRQELQEEEAHVHAALRRDEAQGDADGHHPRRRLFEVQDLREHPGRLQAL